MLSDKEPRKTVECNQSDSSFIFQEKDEHGNEDPESDDVDEEEDLPSKVVKQKSANGPPIKSEGGSLIQPPSIDQLYGQLSMFDQLTEDNYDARGESSDEVEDANTHNLEKYRKKIEVLNKDLHVIYDGEADSEEDESSDSEKIRIQP